MARINADGDLVHTDLSGYTLTATRRPSEYGYDEPIALFARTAAGGDVQITIDFTEDTFRDWLVTMQEWVATWPE